MTLTISFFKKITEINFIIGAMKLYSSKKSKEAHFNRSKIFLLYFYGAYDVKL